MRSAARGGLAAGRGRDVEDALPRLRVERGDDRLARLVLRRHASVAQRGERAEVAGVAHEERGRVRALPAPRRCRARAAPRSTASTVVRSGFTRNVTDGRFVVERERGESRRRGRARRRTAARSNRGATCGSRSTRCRRRSGSGHGGPDRASERSTPLAKPRARSCTTPTVSPTAACGDTPVTSWNAPSRSAARTSGSSDSSLPRRHPAEQEVERALHADRAVDELGHERAVARFERAGGGAARAGGCASTRRRRCGRAPRPRARAGSPVSAARIRCSRRVDRARRRAGPRATRPPASRACPRAAPRRARARPPRSRARRPGVIAPDGDRRSASGSTCARHTFTRRPPTVVHAPGRGLPARTTRSSSAAGRVRVEAELVDGRASPRTSARRPAASGCASAMRGQLLDEQLRCRPRPGGRAARPRCRASPIGTRRVAYTGPVSSPASSCITHTPVSASPARSARSTGAAPRQRGSSEKCTFTKPSGSASSNGTGSSCPNATTTPSCGARGAHVVDDLARLHRRAHREAERLGRDAHRRRIGARAARPAAIGLRDHERDVVAGARRAPRNGGTAASGVPR